MPDSKDYLSTFKGIIGSLEKHITTDKWKNNLIWKVWALITIYNFIKWKLFICLNARYNI